MTTLTLTRVHLADVRANETETGFADINELAQVEDSRTEVHTLHDVKVGTEGAERTPAPTE